MSASPSGTTPRPASAKETALAKEYGASVYLRRDLPLSKPVDKAAMTEKLRKKLPKKLNNRKVAQLITSDGLKIILDNDDWLMVRPSGTEPVLRIYAETATKKETSALLDFGEKLAAGFQK